MGLKTFGTSIKNGITTIGKKINDLDMRTGGHLRKFGSSALDIATSALTTYLFAKYGVLGMGAGKLIKDAKATLFGETLPSTIQEAAVSKAISKHGATTSKKRIPEWQRTINEGKDFVKRK